MNLPADVLQLSVVVSGKRCVPLSFELLDLRLYLGLVQTDDLMVLVHIDVERFADRRDQVFLVQLGVALNSFVIDRGRDLADLSQRHVFELFKRVCHSFAPLCGIPRADSTKLTPL
jgi:hypothetical protein